MERILVACPNYAAKAYALPWWVTSYLAFTYQNRTAFMVDNTPGTLDFTHEIRRRGVHAVHVEPLANPYHTLELCWREITAEALRRECRWVASIEADVICPPQTLNVLVEHVTDLDVLGHGYPTRGCWQGERMLALGCTLISTDYLARTIDLWFDSPEQDIWRTVRRREIDGLLDIQHLDPPEAI